MDTARPQDPGLHEPGPDTPAPPERTARPTVAQIRTQVSTASFEELPALLDALEGDGRAQVARLAVSARRRHEREACERRRVDGMYDLMRSLGGPGIVLGVDEVGRGSVAGPLTVAAVALPDEPRIWGLDDSKKLVPARREELATRILEVAPAVGIAHIEPEEIDACGMAASLRVAMRRAVEDAGVDPQAVLVDGFPVHIHPCEVAVTHGDARVACIAAASIVAKVARDTIMVAADGVYPGYHLAESKGYASPEHIAAIRRKGLSPYHRASFCKNFLAGADGGPSA